MGDNKNDSAAISIHAPRTGSDPGFHCFTGGVMDISIHAPRTGSDRRRRRKSSMRGDFNPRSPHGERHCEYLTKDLEMLFQSTLPARGATIDC